MQAPYYAASLCVAAGDDLDNIYLPLGGTFVGLLLATPRPIVRNACCCRPAALGNVGMFP